MHWVQILVLGLLLGGVYAMMASGLTLLFGVMRVVNLAHAAFILVARSWLVVHPPPRQRTAAYGAFGTWAGQSRTNRQIAIVVDTELNG